MLIAVGEIKVNSGRRAVLPQKLQELAQSISELGLINPITVDRNYTLIAGLHRLEAVKLLGREKIECTVSGLEGLEAELAEIDENVVRSDLAALDYSDLLLRRKEVYESLHPETKHGGDRKSEKIKRTKCPLDSPKSFVDDTAEKLGIAPRTVRRQLQTAKNLSPEAKEIIRSADTKITKKAAMKLSRLEPEKQKEAATLLVSGQIQSVDEYDSQVPSEESSPTEDEQEDEEPEPQGPLSPPSTFQTVSGSSVFRGITSDLKNEAKDCSCTPDSFLTEFTALAHQIQKDIAWYSTSYYEAVYPLLTQEHLNLLQKQADSICTTFQNFISKVRGC